MRRYIFIFFSLLWLLSVDAQNDTSLMTYQRFFFSDGTISSEGYLQNNIPNGYWKTYYENGKLKSEGNRKNFELDSIWKFYDEEGNINLQVNYVKGKKDGERITYLKDEKIVENFRNDVKEGKTIVYYKSGNIKKETLFVKGKEDGIAKEFDEDGKVVVLYQYKKGILLSRQFINRYNSAGNKNGTWMTFFSNGKIESEINYKNGLLDGFSKKFDEQGNLLEIKKYINGELQKDEETNEYEIRYDYFPNGKVKIVGSYLNGVPEGIRREYGEDGKLNLSYVMRNGKVIGEGIIDEKGNRQGIFKEYYENGALKSEGKYSNSIKTGEWKYYYPDNTLEQTGKYDSKGRQTGRWVWYYNSGVIWKQEEFKNGKREGKYIEYSIEGKIVSEGTYLDDIEDGFWYLETGDAREEGKYVDGQFDGVWKTIDIQSGNTIFEGKYTDGLPDGKHIYYWESGLKRMEGRYIMGQKEGEWLYYDSEGKLFLRVGFKNGIEISYDRIILDSKKE